MIVTNKNKALLVVMIVALSATIYSFIYKRKSEAVTINLFYSKNYPADSWGKQKTGLLWALSYLGAQLPKGSFNKSTNWTDSSHFQLNFNLLGFNKQALEALQQITDSIKNTVYYRKYNRLEIGHFISLTIGSSWHYYTITGVPRKFNFQKNTKQNTKSFFVNHSTVAKHHRMINFRIEKSILNTYFIAEEGSLRTDSTFETSLYEVIDIMKNGQLRFAIYNLNGDLVDASPKEYGIAGKPAKCIWCHEIYFSPFFEPTEKLFNIMSPEEFKQLIFETNKKLNNYRDGLRSEIDFKKTQDHTQMELLYISHKEPSVSKLMSEWQLDSVAVKKIIKANKSHVHQEFKFLNNLLYRDSLIRLLNINDILSSESIREPCENNPIFLKKSFPYTN